MVDIRDIRSLTDFQRNAREYVQRIKESGNPVVLTVNGKAELVVQGAESYQKLLDLLDYHQAVAANREGQEEVTQGKTRPAMEALEELRRKHDIPQLSTMVQEYLDRHGYDGVEIRVVREGIRREGGLWHIPVRSNETRRTYRYYEELAEAEDEIRENEKLDVLFVPAG